VVGVKFRNSIFDAIPPCFLSTPSLHWFLTQQEQVKNLAITVQTYAEKS